MPSEAGAKPPWLNSRTGMFLRRLGVFMFLEMAQNIWSRDAINTECKNHVIFMLITTSNKAGTENFYCKKKHGEIWQFGHKLYLRHSFILNATKPLSIGALKGCSMLKTHSQNEEISIVDLIN